MNLKLEGRKISVSDKKLKTMPRAEFIKEVSDNLEYTKVPKETRTNALGALWDTANKANKKE